MSNIEPKPEPAAGTAGDQTEADDGAGAEFTEVALTETPKAPATSAAPAAQPANAADGGSTEMEGGALLPRTGSTRREFDVQSIEDQPSSIDILYSPECETIMTLSADRKLRFLRREPASNFINNSTTGVEEGRKDESDTPFALIHTLGFKEAVTALEFDPQSSRLFVGTGSGRIKTLTVDTATWRSVTQKDVPHLVDDGVAIPYIHWEGPQQCLFAATANVFFIFDYKSSLKRIVSIEGEATSLTFDSARQRVFVGNRNRYVAIYDIAGKRVAAMGPHAAPVTSISFDAATDRLFVGCESRYVYAWRVGEPGKEVETKLLVQHSAHNGAVYCVRWLGSLGRLASSGADHRLCLTDFEERGKSKAMAKAKATVDEAITELDDSAGSGGATQTQAQAQTLCVTETISLVADAGNGVTCMDWHDSGLLVTGSKLRVVVWKMPVEAAAIGASRAVERLEPPALQVADLFFADLIDAILRKGVRSVQHILGMCIEINRPSMTVNAEQEDTPLHIAVASGAPLEIVQSLVEHGKANVNAVNKVKATPLHVCAGIDSFFYLLSRGADPSARDSFGCTPLHYASQRSSVEVESLCKIEDVDQNAQDDKGRTPCLWAVMSGSIECLRMLCRFRVDTQKADGKGVYPILHALNGRLPEKIGVEIALLLLKYKAEPDVADVETGNTPLHLAAKMGYDVVVMRLLEAGANPLLRNKDGQLASAVALTSDSHDALILAEAKANEVIEGAGVAGEGDSAAAAAATPSVRAQLQRLAEQVKVLKADNARLRAEGLESMSFSELCELEAALYRSLSLCQQHKTKLVTIQGQGQGQGQGSGESEGKM